MWLVSPSCLLVMVISYPVFVMCICMIGHYGCGPTSLLLCHGIPVPIVSLNCYISPYWNRVIISESIMVLASFFLSFHWCCMLVIITIYIYYWCIEYWHSVFIGWLNNSVAELDSSCPSGVDLICNKAICVSVWISMYILSIYFENLMHASTCPLL